MTFRNTMPLGIAILFVIALVSACGFGGGSRLSIEITAPASRGTVTDITADGAYSLTAPLAYGQSRIVLRAEKEGATPAQRTISINRALVLTVQEPLDQSEVAGDRVTIAGTVSDPTARVTATGQDVAVSADGSFSYEVALYYAETVLNVTARAADTDPVSQLVTVRRASS